MRLRKPCEHGRYDAHGVPYKGHNCPGGEFLAMLLEITVDSVHPNALECSDLPWPPEDHIKENWRYALMPLGPVREGS